MYHFTSPHQRDAAGRKLGRKRWHMLLVGRLFTPDIMRLPFEVRGQLWDTALDILRVAHR